MRRSEGGRNGARRQGKQRALFHSLFQMGAALAAPFLCFSNGGSECCPHVFSFRFEQGQRLLPPCLSISFQTEAALAALCLFFSFRMGAALAAPMSFLFVLNGWGAACEIHAAPISLSFNWGQHGDTRCPIPFRFEWGQCVSHTPPPVSFGFDCGQHETHTPPPFHVLYPPITGGI